ncbi:glutathione-dependent disulfide-bond oxidoreductase [Moraxella oblonga]|uniref:glutathione-dependent disulfide-bond oxidoreductase n=1 Tax=Moraxella oblonga TaxID=200413 RepID=UPI000832AA9A|nr:glutathione-dependent disulfide-bond oxidoreductase [Moraxella oblonga]
MTNYMPPKVWEFEKASMGGKFGGINRPTAGARHTQNLPKGDKPYQLYSLNTPNGIKVNIILEELKVLGLLDYDAFKINIMAGEQFGTGFVDINPNSKIPALVDYSTDTPISIFESGAILLYLAQKYDRFLPKDSAKNAQTLSWLMWQMGSAPFLGGGFGHFYAYAPEPIEYAINRYAMEAKRQLDVLDKHLTNNQFVVGDEYTIADMAIYPWYGALVLGKLYVGQNDYANYDASQFLSVHEYTNVISWAKSIQSREAVKLAENLSLRPIGE